MIITLQRAHVFVLGDIILDIYLDGDVQRISPEAPIAILSQTHRSTRPGGAANVAWNMASMGAKVQLFGAVGQDEEGQCLLSLCRHWAVDVSGIITDHLPTTCKTRLRSQGQQMIRLDRETIAPRGPSLWSAVIKAMESCTSPHRACVFSDYGKGIMDKDLFKELAGFCRSLKIPLLVDPKSADLSVYAGATLLKPNRKEALAYTALFPPQKSNQDFENKPDIAQLCDHVLRGAQVDNVMLSLSQDGVAVQGKTTDFHHIKTVPISVIDICGAGDTMVAFAAMALAVGEGVLEASMLANRAAGLVCQKSGTSALTLDECQKAWSERSHVGIWEDILKQYGPGTSRKVVFTNGCFDILHVGHIRYLTKAKSLGDVLIVGINSNSSVRRLKGPERPWVDETERAEMLLALSVVDEVFIFDEQTPLRYIQELKPHVLVKGADYRIEDVVGAKEVQSHGGYVFLAEHVPGRSTSLLTKMLTKSLDGGDGP